MKTRIALAVSTALLSMTAHATSLSPTTVTVDKPADALAKIPAADGKNTQQQTQRTRAVFTPEPNLPAGEYRYFVRLIDSPVALYQGGIDGYEATSPEVTNQGNRKLDVNSQRVKSYRQLLNSRQDSVISKARALIGQLDVKQRTTLSYNGLVVKMTQAQAAKLATIEGVAQVQREVLRQPMTDSGPSIIKAPSVWNGDATGVESKGEGMIVGIIDTGINSDHPSFADIGGDEYDHTNPWGEGVYSGDCALDYPELCNDKLIGVHSWPAVTNFYVDYDIDVPPNGEDHNGHGSHTAGTAAGNVLTDISVLDVDGNDSGVGFDSISGVAPHANIVSYQVCLPGENDSIGLAGCFPSLTILAVEHAIENGVDALNYSIGGGTSNPWTDPDALAFLSARKAGIHVATSAGNDGPGAGTVGSPGDAPWLTTVAAYTHDRDFSDKTLDGFSGGDTSAPDTLTGKALTGAFSGSIVYAGDYENPNAPESDPAQCLQPFPENTFEADTIVVCDRGAIARVDKGRNVKAGGASGLVLANVPGGANSVVADPHVLPAIHIDAQQGEMLRTWLSSGEGHMASIGETEIIQNDELARIAAGFTSRGPNRSVPDVIAPSIAAPGVNIFAPYANDQSAGFKENPNPSDFSFLSGTSMASPHIAGALTLLASIHPEWTPAEAQSALMMTADQSTFKEDGVTPSDFFDMGAGYADIEAAAKTGLVMDESYINYVTASPSLGGQPSQINLASMANAKCVDSCSWTRTVKATQAGSWQASSLGMTDGLVLSVSPMAFDLAEGETQELTITADVTNADAGWNFANIQLVAEGMPEIKLPVAVKANSNNIPESFSINADRQSGSFTYSGFVSKELSNIVVGAYDKASHLVDPVTLTVPEDGLDYFTVSFDEMVPNITFSISSETAPDVDLRILNSSFTQIGRSAGADSNEEVKFVNLPADTYYVVVDGFTASTPGGSDEVTAMVTSIQKGDAYRSDDVTVAVDEADGEFSLTFDWDALESSQGVVFIDSGDGETSLQVPYNLVRTFDVAHVTNLSDAMEAGQPSRVSFEVEPNFTNEDREYLFSATVSDGHQMDNVSHEGVVEGNTITWTVVQPALSAESLSVGFDLIPTRAGINFGLMLTNERDGDQVQELLKFGVAEVAPVAMINAPSSVVEKSNVTLSGAASYDGNGDALTYQWEQTGGVPVTFDRSAESISFAAPEVDDEGTILSFKLMVSDGNGNSSSSEKLLTVTDKDTSSGSIPLWVMTLLPLAWMRKKAKR